MLTGVPRGPRRSVLTALSSREHWYVWRKFGADVRIVLTTLLSNVGR
jgi:hypothetical protein